MNHLGRRDFLRSGLAFGALGFGVMSPALWTRQLMAGNPDQDKKIIFIFQRGGNDGINTVIPRGDSQYNTSRRPSLYIPPAQGIQLGNGFAELNPVMAPIMEVFNNTAINGVEGPGNLAVLHRVGYANQSPVPFLEPGLLGGRLARRQGTAGGDVLS